MRKVIYLRHKPTKQTCALLATDADGNHPALANREAFLGRFFIDYIISHSLKVELTDFEIGEYEEK